MNRIKNIAKKMMGLAALAMLTLTNVAEAGATESDFTFNADVRYSQWVTKSRMTNFYRNTTQDGFAVYNENGTKTADGHTAFDYVPGLVAKAIVENVEYYSQFDWAQSWAEPFFYNMAGYCNAYYNSVPTGGGSLDNLNASKMFFGIYNLTKTGGAYASKSIASTTNSHAQTALGKAVTGFGAHNSGYKIGTSTPAYEAGHTIVEGGWWHKETYKDEMWLDGSYMGPALFAQLRNYNGSNIIGDDWTIAYRQIQALWEMCWNPTDKLLYHAFAAKGYNTYSNTWDGFDPTNGVYHSASYWGRAVGWYFLALIDILEQMEKAGLSGTANYTTLQSHLTELAAGLAARQDAETGCWYQLLDENGTFHTSTYNNGNNASSHVDTYNYIESSATALFTAGYLKAIRLGYLPSDTYEAIAKKGYAGLVNNFFATDGNEGVHLFGSCRSAGLGGAAVNANKWRDGSKAYYLLGHDVTRVKKSDRQTEGKILGAFILAATEYERQYQNNTVLFEKDLAPSYNLEQGEEISCPASGSGANITYQWYKDGEPVEGATSAAIAPTASGSYYCKASSGNIEAVSSTTNVTVPGVDTETPVFTTDLAATATATVGTAKTLTVAASHADGYQWYSNTTASNTGGTEIENATSASYTFTPSATGTLYYYCVATNSKATGTQSVASNVCTVTVSEATTYTVTFDATTNGGTCGTASLTQASSGASITLPTATKSGYTFNGWYTASTGGTLRGTSGASYTPTADETLYAQFTPAGGGGTESISWAITTNSFTVTPTITPSSGAHLSNASTSISLTGLSSTSSSKDGYCKPFYGTVVDFNASDDFASISFDVADGYTFTPSSVGMTVYSHGTGNFKYKMIISDSQGTPITVTSNEIQPSSGGEATITFAADAFTGKAFEGTVTIKLYVYNYSNSSTGKRTYIKSPITISGTTAAKGGSSTYTVSYNMNGHGEAIADVTNVTALPDPLPTPEATGYTFGGWYTDSGLNNAATAGASISADTELFAKWTANTYSVHFDANGGEGSMTNESFTYGIEKALTVNAFTRTGYKFDGWATSANGAKVYDNSQSVSNLTATNDGTVDLYAHWTEKAAATVSINPASGNVTVGSTLNISSYVTVGSSTGAIGYSTGDATKATVTSAGVITGVAAGSATIYVTQQEDANYKTGSVTFTVTVTAAPVPVTNYTVKFYNGETQFGDSQTIEEGSTVSAPTTNPTKEGYTFKGWALENGSTVRVTFPYPIYEDVNFYAVWSNTTSGGGEDETIFSVAGAGSSSLSIEKNTVDQELTSTNATITGGRVYITNGESSGKNMIQSKGSRMSFRMTHDDSYLKVVLGNSEVLKAGDKISSDIHGVKNSATRGLWVSATASRPSSAPATTLSVTNTSTSSDAWMTSEDYTVTTGDGICGQNTFYIYRATSDETFFTNFTITREGQGDDITLETVSDYDDFESYAGEGKTVTFKRSFNNGKWTTLVLPFSATTAQVIAAFEYPNDCEFANIKSMTVTAQGTGSISYVTTSHITANTPILAKIKPNDGLSGKEGFTANEYVFTGVTVVNPESAGAVTATSTDGNVTMYGVYKNTARADIDNNSYFLSGGKFYDWSWLSNMTPFTAYIVPQTTSGNTLKGLTFEEDNATGIINLNVNPNLNSLSHGEGWGEVYNLAGQKVGKGYKGMVIKKGKKVIKK